uniref:Uncharacterized protein n=1 Tax=Myoviridae sp. ctqfO1 TaxID=2827710 RepID=A0A8S5T2E8_9CAUD|nr:MAG TPA: hypothetical protein [Myoviridae sp. ctqfO1]
MFSYASSGAYPHRTIESTSRCRVIPSKIVDELYSTTNSQSV